MRKLHFQRLPDHFAICRLPKDTPVPDWAFHGEFFSITQAADELSIVCAEDVVTTDVQAERGWVAFKLLGPFPFSLTGVLSSFIGPLGEAGVSIFAVSTFDTDYVLVKADQSERAISVLEKAGHELVVRSHTGDCG
jgi:uncharacterized protein